MGLDKRKIWFFCLILVILFFLGCKQRPEEADLKRVNIAFQKWVGYGPLYLAQEKGFFKQEELERVTNIIQNLRDFSRIDQPGSLDEYNLNDGIKATLVVAKNEIKYDAELKTELSEVPSIFCNSGQINQVFLNILVNAAQAIRSQKRDDRGTITIRTYATETGVACEISDNGCGIPPDSLSKIFDPFFTTKAVGKGTGLGLSVSYDIIVNKHKGELLIDSTVGEGSKFTIKLPIGEKEPNDNKEIENSEKKNGAICG